MSWEHLHGQEFMQSTHLKQEVVQRSLHKQEFIQRSHGNTPSWTGIHTKVSSQTEVVQRSLHKQEFMQRSVHRYEFHTDSPLMHSNTCKDLFTNRNITLTPLHRIHAKVSSQTGTHAETCSQTGMLH